MFKSFLQNGTAFIISLLLSLLIAELVVRWFAPQVELQLSGLYRSDAALGWTLTPGFSGQYSSNEFDIRIKINSMGLRDIEQPDQFDGTTILAVGDSFFFGSWSNFDDSVLSLLEQKLRTDFAKLRIVKMAVPAYGTAQEATLLKRFIQRSHPDIVLLGMFVGNDVADSLIGPSLYRVDNGLLVWNRHVLDQWWVYDVRTGQATNPIDKPAETNTFLSLIQQWLRLHSHLYQLIIKEKANFTGKVSSESAERPAKREYFWPSESADLTLFDYESYYLKNDSKLIDDGFQKVFDSLSEIKRLVASEHAKLVITLIPTREQVYPARMASRLLAFHLSPNDVDIQKPQKLLIEWAHEEDVSVIDLLPDFREKGLSDSELYFLNDKHWSDKGHALAASIMSQALASNVQLIIDEKK